MKVRKKILFAVVSLVVIVLTAWFLFVSYYKPALSDRHGKLDAELFLSDSSQRQPMIVAFGGSQGGNTWTADYWAPMRNEFLRQGYAVLSIGYFKTENTPESLDRISLNAIYDTIKSMGRHPRINSGKIALLGSSRGGELVLNLASRYKDFDAVVALVPAHATFPSEQSLNTSAWTFNEKEVPYFRIPFATILASIGGSKKSAWENILANELTERNSLIEVEKIDGPVLLLSAADDETWPSQYMCEQIANRLQEKQFKYYYKHYAFEGGHYDTRKHFDEVFAFLNAHFKQSK
jgi:uncharacterized protein